MPHLARYRAEQLEEQKRSRRFGAIQSGLEQGVRGLQQGMLQRAAQKQAEQEQQQFSEALDFVGQGLEEQPPGPPPMAADRGIMPPQAPPKQDPIVAATLRAAQARRLIKDPKQRKEFDIEAKRQIDALSRALERKKTAEMIQGAAQDGIIEEEQMRQLAMQGDAGDYTGVRNAINEARNQKAIQSHADQNWQDYINLATPIINKMGQAGVPFGVSIHKAMQDSQFRRETNPHRWYLDVLKKAADEGMEISSYAGQSPGGPAQFAPPVKPQPVETQGLAKFPPHAQTGFIKSAQRIKESDRSPEEKQQALKDLAGKLGLDLATLTPDQWALIGG